MTCWLARFSEQPCEGRPTRSHLIAKQLIWRELLRGQGRTPATRKALKRKRSAPQEAYDLLWDARTWVWACEYHHHALDQSRKLRVPRASLPQAVEDFARQHGLTWWLDREYGT